jgi:hypothetical protein
MSKTFKQTVFALILAAMPAIAEAADEPRHTIVSEEGSIQIRDYAPMVLAEVDASGDMARAGNTGFRPLANYIFGGNTARSGDNAEISMTTPVTQTRSTEIAMTTPVTQSSSGDEQWRVAFVMPPEWTLETLPIPDDTQVTLREQPAQRLAVIRFRGGPDDSRFSDRETELRAYLSERGERIVGDATYARYDPPWVPTPFRRNEVWLPIAISDN